jgi:hypothetical protein
MEGGPELDGADLAQVQERLALDEAGDGREHEGGQGGFRQVAEGAGQEQEDDRDRRRRGHQRPGGAGATLLVDGRLRHAPADRVASEEAGAHIGRRQGQHLPARRDRIAVLHSKGARDGCRLDEAITKHAKARARSSSASWAEKRGSSGHGSPAGTSGATSRQGRQPNHALAAIDAATTPSTIAPLGSHRSSRGSGRARPAR